MYAPCFPGMLSLYWLSIWSCSHEWLLGRSCHCCNSPCGALLLPIWLSGSIRFSPIFSMLASVSWYLPVRICNFLTGHSLNCLVPLRCPFSRTKDCFWWTVFRSKLKTIRNEHQSTHSSPVFLPSSRWRPSVAYETPRAEDSHVHSSWPPVQCPSGSIDWPLLRCPAPQFPKGLPAA